VGHRTNLSLLLYYKPHVRVGGVNPSFQNRPKASLPNPYFLFAHWPREATHETRVSHFVAYSVLIGPDMTWLTPTKRIWKIVLLLCNTSRGYKHIMELCKAKYRFLQRNDRHEISTPPQRWMLRGGPLVKHYKPFLYRHNSYWPSLSAQNLQSTTFQNVTLEARLANSRAPTQVLVSLSISTRRNVPLLNFWLCMVGKLLNLWLVSLFQIIRCSRSPKW